MSAGGIEDALDPVVDEVEHPAGGRRDDAAAARERLDDDAPEPLGPRRQDEQRRIVELGRDLRREQLRVVLDLVRQVAEEVVDDLPSRCPCRR